jgi:UDP:flavonoid glycosyltransferase YjiC (YdhE family)
MRVLLCTWGSLGDLFPYLGIAERLAADGHEPIIAAPAFYRSMIEASDIAFHAVPPDVDPNDSQLLRRVMDPRTGPEAVVEYVAPAVVDAFNALLPVARDADLIVTHPVTFAAVLAAEALGKRWISTVLAPASFFSIHDFPVMSAAPSLARFTAMGAPAAWLARKIARAATFTWMGPVRALRADLGLPDRGEPLFEGQFSPHGTLALYSRVLGAPQRDWPPHARMTGFIFRDTDAALPDEVARFLDAGDAPIVFTLGSSAVGAAGAFYDDAVEAATALGRRAVLLTGRYRRNLSSSVSTLPSSILAVEYAPHGPLFARAAATVHHGGVGTLGEALRAGRPMLVVPFSHDQPDNGARAERLGVARVLPRRDATAQSLRAELEVLLGDDAYAGRAEEVGQVVGGEDGVGAACRILEEFAPVSASHFNPLTTNKVPNRRPYE